MQLFFTKVRDWGMFWCCKKKKKNRDEENNENILELIRLLKTDT